MPDLDSLNPDQHLALRSAATNLRAHFAGTFSPETIELFLETSYDQFAERAKFTHFLPLIAERFARQRLTALARLEGKADGVPIVLFLCVPNAGRSQMALGWFNRLADGRAIGWSGVPSRAARSTHRSSRRCVRSASTSRRVPEALDRRDPPRGRRRGHHGLRRRLSHLPGQALRGLAARRPRRPRFGRGAPDP